VTRTAPWLVDLDFPALVVERDDFITGVLHRVEERGEQRLLAETAAPVADGAHRPALGEGGIFPASTAVHQHLPQDISGAEPLHPVPLVVLPRPGEPVAVLPLGLERDEVLRVHEAPVNDHERVVRYRGPQPPRLLALTHAEGTKARSEQEMAPERHQGDHADQRVPAHSPATPCIGASERCSVLWAVRHPNGRTIGSVQSQTTPPVAVRARLGPDLGALLEEPAKG